MDPRSSDSPEPPSGASRGDPQPVTVHRKPWFMVLAGAVMIPLSLEPWGLVLLMPVSFLLLARALTGASFSRALLIGWIFGLVVEGLGLPWIGTAVSRYIGIFVLGDPGSATASAAGLGAFLLRWPLASLGWGLCAASIVFSPNKVWLRAMWAGVCFMVMESYWPRIFRWTMGAAYATEDPTGSWLLVQWFGVEEMLFFAVASGFLAASCWDRSERTRRDWLATVPALVLMASPLIGLAKAPLPESASAIGHVPLTVSIVQPVLPLELRHGREGAAEQLKKIRALIEVASEGPIPDQPVLVVLPEGILPQSWKIEWLQEWCLDWLSQPLLIGLSLREEQGYSNAVALLSPRIDPDTRERSIEVQLGRKKELLPFGETVPFGDVLAGLGIELPVTSLVAGKEAVTFDLGDDFPMLGISICYEGILADTAAETIKKGARWHANVTEDLWYGDWMLPAQHLQFQRSRAIESGQLWLRSVNAGITAVIDPRRHGRRSILSSRQRLGQRWSQWQEITDAGQIALPMGQVGVLQVQITSDFSAPGAPLLSLPSSSPMLLIYCILACFWWNLRRMQRV